MKLKLATAALYVRIINQLMESIREADIGTLRFIRGNLRLFLVMTTGKKRSPVIAISEPSTVTLRDSVVIESPELIDMEKTPETTDANQRRIKVCRVTAMRTMTLHRLLKTLHTHHMVPADLEILNLYIEQHTKRLAIGDLFGIEMPEACRNARDILLAVATTKKDRETKIRPVQAASLARKADKIPIIPAGTRVLAILKSPTSPYQSPWLSNTP